MKVPFIDLPKQYKSIKQEVDRAVRHTVGSGTFIMGGTVEKFEGEISDYLDSKVVSCASGSDALFMCLKAADVKAGDEIITTPFTFFATAGAVSRTGATPVFVDIKKDTNNIDPNLIEKKINKKTKGIIPVHIFGLMAEMDKIMSIAEKYNLIVIEDACQAVGAEYKSKKAGTIGNFGTFSFFPTKNLGAYGDGGLISVKKAKHYEYLKMFRLHGSKIKYFHDFVGINSRLDTLQAAVLSVKLRHLDGWNKKRREIANKYNKSISDYVKTPIEQDNSTHVYHQYHITTNQRDGLKDFLSANGISSSIYYPLPLHLQRCFKDLGYKKGDMPVSEMTSKTILSLPIFPEITDEQIDYVIHNTRKFFNSRG